MQYCNHCGSPLESNSMFCSVCGARVGAAQQNNTGFTQGTPGTGYVENEYVPDPLDVEKNKVMAVVAYLGLLVLIPVFGAKDSPFARFHANQGLILMIAGFVISILSNIHWVFSLLSLPIAVFSIMGIVYAFQGKMKPLPLIDSLRILK